MPEIPPTKSSAPLISVIIPTFNRATLLPRALQSARQQTYPNLEILVVDDASTDNTREVVAASGDPRIKYLRHDSNRGGAVARNTGLKAARGDYMAFLDSDDEWLPEKLARQMEAIDKSGALFCYCQSHRQQPDGSYVIGPPEPYTGGSLLHYLGSGQWGIGTPAVLVAREVAVPFDETLSIYQDWDWILQIRRRTDRWVFVSEPLCYFHTDAPVRTQTRRSTSLISRLEPFFDKYAAELAGAPAVRRSLVWACANDAIERGDRALARSWLWKYRVFPSLWNKPRALHAWLKTIGL